MSECQAPQCHKEAEYDIPKPLCEKHWCEWFRWGADRIEADLPIRPEPSWMKSKKEKSHE